MQVFCGRCCCLNIHRLISYRIQYIFFFFRFFLAPFIRWCVCFRNTNEIKLHALDRCLCAVFSLSLSEKCDQILRATHFIFSSILLSFSRLALSPHNCITEWFVFGFRSWIRWFGMPFYILNFSGLIFFCYLNASTSRWIICVLRYISCCSVSVSLSLLKKEILFFFVWSVAWLGLACVPVRGHHHHFLLIKHYLFETITDCARPYRPALAHRAGHRMRDASNDIGLDSIRRHFIAVITNSMGCCTASISDARQKKTRITIHWRTLAEIIIKMNQCTKLLKMKRFVCNWSVVLQRIGHLSWR